MRIPKYPLPVLLLSLAATISAQTVKVDVSSVTATQAIVHVAATNADGSPFAGPCSYRISEGQAFSTLVNDVNPALFAGSNLDSRPGGTVNGSQRYFVAGTRLAAKATDQKFYSRALQTDTQHWAGVTCGAAAEQSATFRTLVLPMGNSFPEFPAFDPTAFGNIASPTVDFGDKTKTYIDPLTGILIKRITGPLEYFNENAVQRTFTMAWNISGSAWTNAANAVANQSPSTFASTSTAGAPLFLPWAPGTFNSAHAAFDTTLQPIDVRFRAYCSGANGGTLQACISLDSGQTCATAAQDLACPTSIGEVDVPTGYPTPMFAGWGAQSQILSKNVISTYNAMNVSVSGSTVTWVSEPVHGVQFYAYRAPGSKLQITGTAPGCPNNICTVASYVNPTQITIQETVAGTVSGVMQDLGSGIRVWLKNTGGAPSVNANFTFDYVTAHQFLGGTNAEFDACSSLPITDINTDAKGTPLPAPLSGFLCSIGGQGPAELFLWIPSTGEARLMSTFSDGAGNLYFPPSSPFSGHDSKTLFASDRSNNLWRGVLNSTPGQYVAFLPSPTSNSPGNVTWTNLTSTATPLDQQVANYGGTVAMAYAQTRLFNRLSLIGVIGGYAYYNSQTSQDGQDGPCIRVRTLADTNQIVDAITSFDIFPMRWGACHVAAVGTGTFENIVVNAPQAHDATANPLAGPWRLNITHMHRGGGWQSFSEPITAATNANPVQFTAVASGLDFSYNTIRTDANAGPTVTLSGGTGAWAAANGKWIAHVPNGDADHFTIPALNSTNFGPLTGSLTIAAAPPIIHSEILSISRTSPAMVTTSTIVPTKPLLPNNHRLRDADPIGFGSDASQTQYYAKVTGYSNSTFGLFADPALTIPVDGNNPAIQNLAVFQLYAFGEVYLAETCPTDISSQWTTSSALDSGATGLRCISFRVDSEPYSLYPNPGEQSTYPCPSDPTNSGRSCLQPIQPGDMIRDIGINVYTESMMLVKKVKNSETDIELTFARWAPNRVKDADNHNGQNSYPYTHDFGWSPFMVASNSHAPGNAWLDALDPTHTFVSADPTYAVQHGDVGEGNAPGLVTFAAGQSDARQGSDSISDKTLHDLLSTPLTFTKNESPVWADSASTQMTYGYHIQSYPGHRQMGAPVSEHYWKGDWYSLNPSYGGGQTGGGNLISGMTVAQVAGTSHVYKVANVVGSFDRKRTPTYAWSGHYMFKDKSGPGSLLTDTDSWQYCVADFPGECRPGSVKNDAFMSMPLFFDNGGNCLTNNYNLMAPCLIGANPMGGWAAQFQINPVDVTARRFRKLTLGFTAPAMHWTFTTWVQTPGGKWGFFTAPYVNGLRNDYFAMKLPPWPGTEQGQDSTNRSTFVPKQIPLAAKPGTQYARARFGYSENGSPSSLFCTSRQEACSTDIPVASATDPYSYVSEPVTRMPCGSGCTITIPTIPGRILYYVIDRLDASGNVVSSGPVEVLAVP